MSRNVSGAVLQSGLMLCCLTMLLTVAEAQEGQRNLNWAEKMFSELKVDFGNIARGADARYQLIITNIYEEDVRITKVDTTCGCTAASPDRELLKTHEQAAIEVQMDTEKFSRRKDSNVDVTFSFEAPQGNATRTVRVPITAYIRPDVVLKPGNADFGSVEFGQGAEQVLEIAYAGRSDWKIREVRVGREHLRAEVQEISRGSGRVGYRLKVALDDRAPMGAIRDQVVLITDDANAPEVPVLVTGKVEPDIVITPADFPLGRLSPGQEKTFNVVLKGKRPFSIENIECDSKSGCFEVMQLPGDSKSVHVVPFRLKTPDRPGEFSETFTLSIAGRPEPLTFRAAGTITGGS